MNGSESSQADGPASGPSASKPPTHQPEQAALAEISGDQAAQIMGMISEFKDAGQISKGTDDYQLMLRLHEQMMREKQMAAAYKAALAGKPSLAPATPSPHVSIKMDSTEDELCTSHQTPGEKLLATITNMLRTNPGAINDQDEEGDTLLHRVSFAGQEKLVSLLLVNGANVNCTNNLKKTAFHQAAKAGEIMVMQLLLECGAAVDAVDENGWTAVHHAAASEAHLAPQSLHYLTECCSLSLSTLTKEGQSVLHIVANKKKDNNRFMLPMLLSSADLDVSWVDKNGSNALHYAAQCCQPNMCYKFVCKRGAKIASVTNSSGDTPLSIAKRLPTLQGFELAQEMESWVRCGPNHKPSDSVPSRFYHLLLMPFILTIIGVTLSYTLTPHSQGFICLATELVIILWLFRPATRIDQIGRFRDPSRLGALVTGLGFILYIIINRFTCDQMIEEYGLTLFIALYICVAVTAVLFYRLVTGDPGFTFESKRKESGEFYTMKDLVTLKRPSVWCPICQLIPTKPSKHCKQCERCVYWMDHHCLYTMKCIGYKNHYVFVWFSITLVLMQTLTLYLLSGYVKPLKASNFMMSSYLQIFMHDGLLTMVAVGLVGFTALTAPLLGKSLINISAGYTDFFKPRKQGQGHIPGLPAWQRLMNIIVFLWRGKIKYKDPNFSM